MNRLTSLLATERSRSRALAVIVALVLAVGAPRLYAQVRIAVVDMQRSLLDTEDGRRAKNQLKKLFEDRQTELNGRQDALKRMKEDIEKQKNVLSRDALQKRMDEYSKAFLELQQSFNEYQAQLAQKEAELTKQILVNLQGVVRQIGTADGYTVILDSGAVVWSPTHLDLTDRVIQEYNAQHPVTQAPATPATPTPPAAPAGDAGARPPATPRRDAGARPPGTGGASPHPRAQNQP
ncbi:MAG: OmpH family outer membrane protein [Deltaproteobacteria bacterium]|nr:OmpH family outer membrane protein [Deltaproteobacteria bacterium]